MPAVKTPAVFVATKSPSLTTRAGGGNWLVEGHFTATAGQPPQTQLLVFPGRMSVEELEDQIAAVRAALLEGPEVS